MRVAVEFTARFQSVITFLAAIHVEQSAIEVCAPETVRDSKHSQRFRGTRHHKSGMERATGSWRGVRHRKRVGRVNIS